VNQFALTVSNHFGGGFFSGGFTSAGQTETLANA
jgi:hypothetical protein